MTHDEHSLEALGIGGISSEIADALDAAGLDYLQQGLGKDPDLYAVVVISAVGNSAEELELSVLTISRLISASALTQLQRLLCQLLTFLKTLAVSAYADRQGNIGGAADLDLSCFLQDPEPVLYFSGKIPFLHKHIEFIIGDLLGNGRGAVKKSLHQLFDLDYNVSLLALPDVPHKIVKAVDNNDYHRIV